MNDYHGESGKVSPESAEEFLELRYHEDQQDRGNDKCDHDNRHRVEQRLLDLGLECLGLFLVDRDLVQQGFQDTGLFAGIVAVSFPPAGLILGGGAILALSLAGAGVGAWISSMIGSDVPNSQLKEFQASIDAGQLLFMLDVPKVRVDEISELVKKHHPEAEIEGTEPTVPAFP